MFRKVHGRIISVIYAEQQNETVQLVYSRKRRMLAHTIGQGVVIGDVRRLGVHRHKTRPADVRCGGRLFACGRSPR